MRRRGMTPPAIEAALLAENRTRCTPPLAESEIRSSARSVSRYEAGPITPQRAAERQGPAQASCVAVLETFASIVAREVRWLWPNRVARGKITLFAGNPGLGKSLTTVDMAARVSTGTPFCDGSPCVQGDVIFLSAEDDSEDTIKPRLTAAGADVERVHLLRAVRQVTADGKSFESSFNLKLDVDALEDALNQFPETRLLVIDPISAYLGGTDSHKNAEVRGLLAPLAEIAARHSVAIVGITHLSKSSGDPMYRAIGSLAFIAAARASWVFVKGPENPAQKLMLPLKNKLAPEQKGLAFKTLQAPNGATKIEWESGEVDPPALVALASQDPAERDAVAEAEEFLRDALAKGPIAATAAFRRARAVGIADRTLKRAKRNLGVSSCKGEFTGGWAWAVPDSDMKGAKNTAKRAKPEHLAFFDEIHYGPITS